MKRFLAVLLLLLTTLPAFAQTTVYNPGNQGGDDGGGSNEALFRIYLPSSAFINAGTGATQVRVTFLGGTANGTASGTLGTFWFGRAASASTLNFNGNQVQLTFGGSGTFTNASTASWTETSDFVNFAGGETFDPTQNYIIAYYYSSSVPIGLSQSYYTISGADVQFIQPAATDTSGNTNAGAGWTTLNNTVFLIDTIQVQTSGPPSGQTPTLTMTGVGGF